MGIPNQIVPKKKELDTGLIGMLFEQYKAPAVVQPDQKLAKKKAVFLKMEELVAKNPKLLNAETAPMMIALKKKFGGKVPSKTLTPTQTLAKPGFESKGKLEQDEPLLPVTSKMPEPKDIPDEVFDKIQTLDPVYNNLPVPAKKALYGIIRGLGGLIEGFTTPKNIALISGVTAGSAVSPVVAVGASAYFTYDILKNLAKEAPEIAKQAVEAIKEGDIGKTTELLTSVAGSLYIAKTAGKHAGKGTKSIIADKVKVPTEKLGELKVEGKEQRTGVLPEAVEKGIDLETQIRQLQKDELKESSKLMKGEIEPKMTAEFEALTKEQQLQVVDVLKKLKDRKEHGGLPVKFETISEVIETTKQGKKYRLDKSQPIKGTQFTDTTLKDVSGKFKDRPEREKAKLVNVKEKVVEKVKTESKADVPSEQTVAKPSKKKAVSKLPKKELTLERQIKDRGGISKDQLAEYGITPKDNASLYKQLRGNGKADDIAKTLGYERADDMMGDLQAFRRKRQAPKKDIPKPSQGEEIIRADDLKVGDSFKVNGEEYKVVGKNGESVKLIDGVPMEISPDGTVVMDAGSYKPKSNIKITTQGKKQGEVEGQMSFASSVQATAPKGKIKPKTDKGSDVGMFEKPKPKSNQTTLYSNVPFNELKQLFNRLRGKEGKEVKARFSYLRSKNVPEEVAIKQTLIETRDNLGVDVAKGIGKEKTPEAIATRQKLQRQLLKKSRNGLLSEIQKRKSDYHPAHWKNFLLKHFQTESYKGLSDKDLRSVIVKMEERNRDLYIPTTTKIEEVNNVLVKELKKKPVPGLKTITNIRRFSEPIADMAEGYHRNAAQWSNQLIDKYMEVVSMVGKKNWEKFVDVIEGKKTPTKSEAEALTKYREIMDSIGNKATDLQLEVTNRYGFARLFEKRENYWPQKHTLSEIDRILSSEKKISEIADANKITPEEVRTKLAAYRYNLQSPRYGNLERSREFNIGGYRKDWQAGLEYILGSVDRLSYVNSFGKDLWYGQLKLPSNVIREIGSVVSPNGRDFLLKYFQRLNERKSPSTLRDLAKIQRNLTAFKLTLAPVRNMFQTLIGTLPKVGFIDYTKGLWNFITSPKKSSSFASKAGAKAVQIEMEITELALNSNNPFVKLTGKAAEKFLKYNLFSFTETAINRTLTPQTGMPFLDRITKGYLKQGYRKKYYETELKKLFVDYETLKKTGVLSEQDIANAAYHLTKMTQFTAKIEDLPLSWSSDAGRWVTQLKNFAYNQSSLMWNEGFKEFTKFVKTGGKEGNAANLIRFMIMLPIVGKLSDELYQNSKLGGKRLIAWVLGKDPSKITRDDWKVGQSKLAEYCGYVLAAGGFGIAGDAVMSMQYGIKGIYSLVGGPNLGDAVNTTLSVYDAINAYAIENDPDKAKMEGVKWIASHNPAMRILIEASMDEYREQKLQSKYRYLIQNTNKRYIRYMLNGDAQKALNLYQDLNKKIGADYFKRYGKMLLPPGVKENGEFNYKTFESWIMKQNIPKTMQNRKTMPGKTVK